MIIQSLRAPVAHLVKGPRDRFYVIDHHHLSRALLFAGHKQVSVVRKEQILPFLAEHPLKGGVMIFMGAGDIGEIASEFVSHLDVCASA